MYSRPHTSLDPLLGQLFGGQYLLEECIGQGGSGDVYRARQLGVERQVAIKVLHANMAGQTEFAKRFVREARAAAALTHPNIITVFQLGVWCRTPDHSAEGAKHPCLASQGALKTDANSFGTSFLGESPEGLPYIAMEWADAKPIGQDGPTLRESEILVAAQQIASALCAAHAAGIIHRDLKPENVLLQRHNGMLHVVLLDFGVAKIVNAELRGSGETNLTQAGLIYGTPQYLSPEQAAGRDVDARADLYSLGIMLYELFSGGLPFDSQGIALLVDHLDTKPEHLAKRAPHIAPEVAALVMQLLEKEPDDRPASAEVVLAELHHLSAKHLVSNEFNTSVVPHTRSRTRLGLMMAALLWLLSVGSLGTADAPVQRSIMMAQAHEPVVNVIHEHREPAYIPQRALLLSSSDYSLRVLLPEYLGANTEHVLAVELWDASGRPVLADTLVLVFANAAGEEKGVSVPASSIPGHYEVPQKFSEVGVHSMKVLPTQESSLEVHFEVEPEAKPSV